MNKQKQQVALIMKKAQLEGKVYLTVEGEQLLERWVGVKYEANKSEKRIIQSI
ncbi:hypothetical protein [Bacillus sp. FJAT-45350]|uniref:hypothetical protein n=1 Tax=Bacillus sp. FJAT-45350 TaxID=2011014 RepID=UPI0015CE7B91|nr:hypothetical protein [Bacillus sp. FJAT-45350]